MSCRNNNRKYTVFLAVLLAVVGMFAQPRPAKATVFVCANCSTEITQLLNYVQLIEQLVQQVEMLKQLQMKFDFDTQNMISLKGIDFASLAAKEANEMRSFVLKLKYYKERQNMSMGAQFRLDFADPEELLSSLMNTPERYKTLQTRAGNRMEYLYGTRAIINKKTVDAFQDDKAKEFSKIQTQMDEVTCSGAVQKGTTGKCGDGPESLKAAVDMSNRLLMANLKETYEVNLNTRLTADLLVTAQAHDVYTNQVLAYIQCKFSAAPDSKDCVLPVKPSFLKSNSQP